jgi:plastocyanin
MTFPAFAILAGMPGAAFPSLGEDVAHGTIAQHRFLPGRIAVKAGTAVRWINQERRTGHSVRFSGPGGFQSGIILPGQNWTHTYDKPGIYTYTCAPHPDMRGMVEVTE